MSFYFTINVLEIGQNVSICEYFVAFLRFFSYIIIVLQFEVFKMSISYNKLWKQLIDKNMTKTDLRMKADIGTSTLAKLGKNEQVSLDVLLRICKVLNCDISEIMEIIKENQNV